MRTLTLLRLILRLLREIRIERQEIATQLRVLNATLNQLLLIHAQQANFYPPSAPPPPQQPPRWALGKDDAQVFVEAEAVRLRLIEKLGREPFDEELWRELEGTVGRRESRV